MPRRLLIMVTILVGGCSRADAQTSPPASAPSGPFVVHEWGTFTSFQGVDGVSVDGMQHETEALPSFVHSRVDPKTSPLAIYGDRSRDVPVRNCRGKMETPVIYFHSEVARHVKVHVELAGLLTQWYPAASRATPAFTGGEQHDLGAVAQSSLDWDLDLVPTRDVQKAAFPPVDPASDWEKAREVAAASVRSAGAASEAEQYVFYRGLMSDVAQPRVVSAENGDVVIVNGSPHPIAEAFVLDMKVDTARFVATSGIVPGARPVSFAGVPERAKREVVSEIERATARALVRQGLHDDEARAMVRTWSETWFSAEGTRVLYLVPRPLVDAALPLQITPLPDAVVRVMVGRVETMTRHRASQVERDVAAAGSEDASVREAAFARLARMGRFVEPAVRAVATRSDDSAVRNGATVVLRRLAVR